VLARPLLRPDLRLLVDDGRTLVLGSEREHIRLSGSPVADVLPLLDGTRGPADVVAALRGRAAPEDVYYTLLELERRGYVVEAGDDAPSRRALLAGLGVAPPRLVGSSAVVATIGGVDPGPVLEALDELGVPSTSGDALFAVVLVDDYLSEGLGDENRAALSSGRPWLLAKPVGTVLWLGPLFIPGQTGCWECLAHRLRGHRPVEELAAVLEPTMPRPATPVATAATAAVAAGLVATEVAKELAGGGSALRGRVLTLDLAALAPVEHVLTRRPQCPACGDPELVLPTGVRVELRPLRAPVAGGGARVREPEDTVRDLADLVSPITGVVASLNRADVPPPLHLYGTGRVPAAAPISAEQLDAALRLSAAGKGPTDAQARASALCEGVERYCAHAREARRAVEAPYAEVADRAFHPDELLLFSELQRREREERNAGTDDPRFQIPEPFDETRRIAWTEGWSLVADEPRLLPSAYCYLGYPLPEGHRFCRGDSNGCAAGNEPEEAILQGMLELVERDAVALWWYNRARRPGLAVARSGMAYVDGVLEAFATLDRAVWTLDLTNDLAIPAVAALSCSSETGTNVTFGFGAHLDPAVALSRAVSELVQMTFSIRGPRRRPMLERWLAEVGPEEQRWLAAEGEVEVAPPRSTDDLASDIRSCTEAISRAGHDVVVVDLTLPDVGVPVVKVVAPGLRHFWPRFAPGRLYDVPVALGWLDAPTAERELNPYPMVW
jgi:bacteriocin biosynthesis cyclodehydratase domain-containing protein